MIPSPRPCRKRIFTVLRAAAAREFDHGKITRLSYLSRSSASSPNILPDSPPSFRWNSRPPSRAVPSSPARARPGGAAVNSLGRRPRCAAPRGMPRALKEREARVRRTRGTPSRLRRRRNVARTDRSGPAAWLNSLSSAGAPEISQWAEQFQIDSLLLSDARESNEMESITHPDQLLPPLRGSPTLYKSRPPGPLGPGYTPRPLARPDLGARQQKGPTSSV